MRLGKILFFLWLWALAMGAQAVAAPGKSGAVYDELVSGHSIEYWDQDAQLLYLRARWYDPTIGQFISADPFQGKQRNPRSLNRYAYASADPVHKTDPSGAMSLGELNAGLDMQGVLMNVAKDQAFSYLQNRIFGEDDTLDGPPSLYEMLLATLLKSLAGSASGEAAGAGMAVLAATTSSGTQQHHVIPEYMCGAKNQMDLVNLDTGSHQVLHAQMNRYKTVIDIAGLAYEVIFKKRKKSMFMSKVNELARTPIGRAAIAAALEAFYYENDWFMKGSGARTRAPIGVVLAFEAPEYIAKNHQYSKTVPCKK